MQRQIDVPPARRPYIGLIVLAYVGFISLGLPDGLLGVGWPSIRATFQLSLDALGALLTAFTLGYLGSSFSSGRILAHIGLGNLLTLSGAATAISLIGYALVPIWAGMVLLAVLAGLGAGAIDAGLNTFVATNWSTRTLNWLHASFGIGAAAGPLVMTAILSAGYAWRWGYALVGGAQLGLAVCFALTRARWESPAATAEVADEPVIGARTAATLRLPAVWLGIITFLLYTGVEVTAGQWSFTLLTLGRSVPRATAGMWVSVYWASLTVGRVLFGFIAGVASVTLLLRCSLLVLVAGTILLALDVMPLLNFVGLALMGLALAPMFPSLIATTPTRLGAGHAANAIGFQVAAAALGGAILPGTVGVLANRFGLESIGVVLIVASLCLLLLHEALQRRPHPL